MNAIESLDQAIRKMEAEHASSHRAFRETLALAGESIKPSSIIKHMINPGNDKEDGDIEVKKTKPLIGAVGIASGFITKKLLLGATHNPLLKLAGYLVQVGVTELVSRHPEQVKQVGNKLLQLVTRKKSEETTSPPETPDV
jgi:hypothetical protein